MEGQFCRDHCYGCCGDDHYHSQCSWCIPKMKKYIEEKFCQEPRDLELEVYEELCVGCSDEKICHEECEHCVQFYERLEEKEND